MSIIGWCGSNSRTAAMGSLEYVPFYSGLCALFSHPPDGSGPPLSPPSDIPPSELLALQCNLPARASLSPPLASSTSVCCVLPPPPSSAGCHRPSARMTNWQAVPCCPGLSVQHSDVAVCPRPVRLVVLGSDVGGGASETVPSLMILMSSMHFHHTRKFTTEKYLRRS